MITRTVVVVMEWSSGSPPPARGNQAMRIPEYLVHMEKGDESCMNCLFAISC